MLWKIAKAGTDPVVAFAAEELARYLRRMDPALEAPVFQYPAYEEDISAFWLEIAPEKTEKVENPQLDDAYTIRVERGVGAVVGSNPRSVLLGVYRLLKEMGCAWVRPGGDGEIIPRRDAGAFRLNLQEKAANRHRGICIEGSAGYEQIYDMLDWMPKMGFNAYFLQFHIPVNFFNRWYDHTSNPDRPSEALSTREIEAIQRQVIGEIKKRGMLYHADGHGWTCDPFGIPGESWAPSDDAVPKASVKYLAKVNGRRTLHDGVALNTNLCYSNPAVRRKIADAVAQRCTQVPEIDYVHVWFADGLNNHCECENCRKMRPSDWYVTLLNDIDEKLTKKKLNTRVVFLMYLDLLWAPEQVTLKNPDRFVLMFAPITRTFTNSISQAPVFDQQNLPPYERNHLKFPSSVSENLAWLRKWQENFHGDGFDYDYHFGRGHYADPGYCDIAKVMFEDMKGLHRVGLNGMMSCQSQRVFLPTGLGMAAMSTALWDADADFAQMADRYFREAFGPEGGKAYAYLQELTRAFDPPYLRREKPEINPESAASLARVPEILDAGRAMLEAHAADNSLCENQKMSWKYLLYHAEICRSYARCFQLRAQGEREKSMEALQECYDYVNQHEQELLHVFDGFKFQNIVQGMTDYPMGKRDYQG